MLWPGLERVGVEGESNGLSGSCNFPFWLARGVNWSRAVDVQSLIIAKVTGY